MDYLVSMKINIVTVRSGWILSKIAERLCSTNQEVFQLDYSPRNDVDANFYIDMQNCFTRKTNTLDIGFFTHLHENSTTYITQQYLLADYIVHMCTRYYDAFKHFYPKDRMCVLYPFEIASNFNIKKPTIGIFQRGEYEGKGFFFMDRMAKYDIMNRFRFLFVGSGWDKVVNRFIEKGIDVEYQTSEEYSEYPSLYEKIDYLLIPSLWEGGPMSVVEAYAMGIPIISSDVGWVGSDFEVEYIYEPNNECQLESVLNNIYAPIEARRKKFSDFNYENYGKKIINIVEDLV
tara:strand:- start:125 stop:991 length:867 start_codon:yes stop_codon:yes gene_type:complete